MYGLLGFPLRLNLWLKHSEMEHMSTSHRTGKGHMTAIYAMPTEDAICCNTVPQSAQATVAVPSSTLADARLALTP